MTIIPPPTGLPVMVQADPDRIAQVIDNILNNAISYAGPQSKVALTLTEGSPVTLMITDTGCGIPAAHLPKIFDPFYRVDAARSPGAYHSGLGLRIARGLMEAHGGSLEVQSREGQGTRVTLRFP